MNVFALIGPMGTGKTTLYNKLIERGLVGIKEMTTRPMRLGEENSNQYIFVDDETFKEDFRDKQVIGASSFIVSSGDVYKYGFNVHSLPIDCEEDCVVQANYQNINDLKEFYGKDLIVIKLSRDVEDIIKSVSERGDDLSEIKRRLKKDISIYENVKADYTLSNLDIDIFLFLINNMR